MEATTFFTFSILFLSFAPKLGEPARPSHGIVPPAVVDTSGNKVREGEYYDLWAGDCIIGIASTISPLVEGNRTCWVQHKFQPFFNITIPSVPVTFSLIEPHKGNIIPESTALNIEFVERGLPDVCGDSWWRVSNHTKEFVVVGTHSGSTIKGFFIIERISNDSRREYNILFCPVLGSDSLQHSFDDCQIVGISAGGKRSGRLALDHTPVRFAFVHQPRPKSDQHIKMSVT